MYNEWNGNVYKSSPLDKEAVRWTFWIDGLDGYTCPLHSDIEIDNRLW